MTEKSQPNSIKDQVELKLSELRATRGDLLHSKETLSRQLDSVNNEINTLSGVLKGFEVSAQERQSGESPEETDEELSD